MIFKVPALEKQHSGNPNFELVTSGFEVSGKGYVCLIGNNGSGKSTFGEALASASIQGAGEKWYYLPQHLDRFLFAENVVEQLGTLLAQEINTSALIKVIDDLGFPDPEGMLDFPFLLMSGGERRRMALVCVLYLNPMQVILDEPEIGVTLKENVVLLSKLHNLTANHARIIVISHNFEFVRQSTDIVCLVHGKIDRVGRTQELLADPTFELHKYGVRFT